MPNKTKSVINGDLLFYHLPVPKPSLLRHGDGGISNVATDFPGVALEPAPSRHIFLAIGVATTSSPGIFESRT